MTIDDLRTPDGSAWCHAVGWALSEFSSRALEHHDRLQSQGDSEWTRPYLGESLSVLESAQRALGSLDKALLWVREGELAPFDGVTPLKLLAEGRTDDALACLWVMRIGAQRAAEERRSRLNLRTVMFLDFDDVICLDAEGMFDVMRELLQEGANTDEVLDRRPNFWRLLFDPQAVQHLAFLHGEFKPEYVLSTSWRYFFGPALVEIMKRCDLDFVVENLHGDNMTKVGLRHANRWREIQFWLGEHPAYIQNFVILDDTLSGRDIQEALAMCPDDIRARYEPFIVLCQPTKGITHAEFCMLRSAFLLRRENLKRTLEQTHAQWEALHNDLMARAAAPDDKPSAGEDGA
ncbi:HAD domain-containing protein [Variovorax sp. J22R133]|uniref:HAD domain-containing protein n=1 Tax=Variovorax brevis TaxID=3053503 RepID=UPI00257923F2|nr:HAD domain-containing protein [Variovorax sp. J22R133]MDM0116220.1 HAD domain-containing protein [Variovorax sp. J22R133]